MDWKGLTARNMSRIFMTGATGFLGARTLRTLLDMDDSVEIAVLIRPEANTWRIEEELKSSRVIAVEGRFEEVDSYRKPMRLFAPHTVAHLGWSGVEGKARNEPHQVDINIQGTVDLARVSLEAGASRWLGLGSQAEYGPSNAPLDESARAQPTTLYGAAKLSCFHLTRTICQQAGVEFAWMRVFSLYGPRDNPDWLIPYVIRKILSGEAPKLTSGSQLWDYLYIDDAADAVAKMALCRKEGVFNLGSGYPLPVRSIVEKARDLIDPKFALQFGQMPFRPDQVTFLSAKTEALCSAIDWRPETGIPEGLAKTVEWFKTEANDSSVTQT